MDDLEKFAWSNDAIKQASKLAANATTPRTLYVRRQVLNGKDIQKWAKAQGFKTTLKPSDMHVTIAYSKTPVDWVKIGAAYVPTGLDGKPLTDLIVPEGGPRVIETFGKPGEECVVLAFSSPDLKWRHEWIRDCGAHWSYADYTPHITLTYKKGDVDLGGIEPYQGEIVLGPEIWQEVKSGWSDNLVENKRGKASVQKRNGRGGNGHRKAKRVRNVRAHSHEGKKRRPVRTRYDG
ncbi:MAG: hypothetical protein AB7Q00_14600 [Phycisphaerales bacterium]